MHDYLKPDYALWSELALALAMGAAVIAGLAALAEGTLRSAVWRRTVWQVALMGLLALLLVELTGMGPVLAHLCSTQRSVGVLETAANAESQQHRASAKAGESSPVKKLRFSERHTVAPVSQHPAVPNLSWVPAGSLAWAAEVDGTAETSSGSPWLPDEGILAAVQSIAVSPAAQSVPPRVTVLAERAAKTTSSAASCLLSWPAVIWIMGSVWFAGRFVRARWLLRRFQRVHLPPGDDALCRRVAALAEQLGMRRRVRVLQTAGHSAPVAFGSLRPTVALPASFLDDYERPQQDAVLAHELAHLSAFDPAWQQAANLLCAALWWHPLVWWMRRRLQAASEAAADEASLLVPGGPDALAECLVSLGRRLQPATRLEWLSVEGDRFRSGLGRRVQRLLRLRGKPWRAPARRRLLPAKTALPLIVVLVAVSCTAWVRPQATLSEGVTTMNVLTGSWRNSLAATVLLALVGFGGDAAADDPGAEALPVASTGENSAEESPLQAMLEDDDREEGEGRHHEEGEHDEDARHEDEEHQRHEAEQREHEQRERHEAEAREREEHQRREAQERRREELMRHREGLRERAADIERGMSQLRDDEDEAAREMHEQLRRVIEEIREVERRLRGDDRPREDRDRGRGEEKERGQIAKRIDELRHQIHGLVEAGRHEAAERLENHVRELIERVEGRRDERRPEPRDDVQRRIEHLKIAIDNLHAAGLHDQAERLVQEIERLHHEHGEGDRPERRGDHPPDESGRAVAELREEVQRLREEMDEMRGLLHELLEQNRRGNERPVNRIR